MKRILLALLLAISSLISYSQSDEFTRVYTERRVLDSETLDVLSSNMEVTFVVFNPDGINMIRIIRGEDITELYQVSEVETDFNSAGDRYQSMDTITKAGEEIHLAFYDQDIKGMLLMFYHNDQFKIVNFRNPG